MKATIKKANTMKKVARIVMYYALIKSIMEINRFIILLLLILLLQINNCIIIITKIRVILNILCQQKYIIKPSAP